MIYNMPENLTVLFVQIDTYSPIFVFLGFCDTGRKRREPKVTGENPINMTTSIYSS